MFDDYRDSRPLSLIKIIMQSAFRAYKLLVSQIGHCLLT